MYRHRTLHALYDKSAEPATARKTHCEHQINEYIHAERMDRSAEAAIAGNYVNTLEEDIHA